MAIGMLPWAKAARLVDEPGWLVRLKPFGDGNWDAVETLGPTIDPIISTEIYFGANGESLSKQLAHKGIYHLNHDQDNDDPFQATAFPVVVVGEIHR